MFVMGSSGLTVSKVDPYFNNVSLLLSEDSAAINGANNNQFLDSSSNKLSITRNGNVTQGTFSPFSAEPGKWSNYFDGSGDYHTIASSPALNLNAEFTWEAWVYFSSISATSDTKLYTKLIVSPSLTGIEIGVNTASKFYLWLNGATRVTGSTIIQPNSWVHLAATRDTSSNIMIFVNGGLDASGTYSGDSATSAIATIGAAYNFISGISGSISNLRVIKGVAVYTGKFTPPSQAPLATSGSASAACYPSTTNVNTTFPPTACSLLTCQDNRFKDNSPNNLTLTPYGDVKVTPTSPLAPSNRYTASVNGGSGYFNGSSYLNYSRGTASALGTSTATVEFWMYPLANSGFRRIVTSTTGSFTANDFLIRFNAGDFLAGGGSNFITAPIPGVNQWYHVAWVGVNGTSQTLYINGVSVGTAGSYNLTIPIQCVGGMYSVTSSEYFVGYLTDIREVNGTAVYTSNFPLPTFPLTAIANTSLLCNFTNANIIDYSRKNDLETVGNAQVSTTTKKFGTGAMYFDGNGDYLTIPSSPDYNFGTGDFTVEFYVNKIAHNQYPVAIEIGNHATTNGMAILLNTNSATSITVWSYNTGYNSQSMPNLNQWYHVACVRYNGILRIYVDGVSSSGVSFTNNLTGGIASIGYCINWNGGAGYYLNGYIDDFRITKGIARYPSSPVPTAAFPRQ